MGGNLFHRVSFPFHTLYRSELQEEGAEIDASVHHYGETWFWREFLSSLQMVAGWAKEASPLFAGQKAF